MKTMKAEIFIEQYGNGISLKWKDVEDNIEPEAVVALDNDKINTVGKIIWDDITLMMDQELCNVVKMTIEYQAVKGEHEFTDNEEKLNVLNFIRKETCCGLAEANNALLELIKVLKERPLLIMDKPRKLKIEWEEQQ